MRLKNKVAVVTGASRGIGRAIAIALAAEGAKVVVNYFKNKDLADDVVSMINKNRGFAMAIQADVSDRVQVKSMVGKVAGELGNVDILVNSAGIIRDHTVKKMTDDEWDVVISVNLTGVFNCVKLFLPYINKNARIVNISSLTAYIGNFGQANYCAAKAGVNSLTKTLAKELARDGITVNAVAPGFIETDMSLKIPTERIEKIKKMIPLGSTGEPEEVAKLVLYLLTDGGYITGQVIHVDGGMVM